MRILLVEDDQITGEHVKRTLNQKGYAVDLAQTIKRGYQNSQDEQYDLGIFDRMLPDGEGLDLCKKIRQDGGTFPILILTALGTTEDIIRGLDDGADDYLTKPFLSDELLARVRALSRRIPTEQVSANIELKDLIIDINSHQVYRREKPIDLTPKEFSLLLFLARNKNMAFDRVTLYSRVWDEEADLFSNSLDVHIRNIRAKIGDIGHQIIRTIRGKGYAACDK